MKIPSLQEAVDVNPALYDAMRARDSAANYVCELMARGMRTKEAFGKWRKHHEDVKRQFAIAAQKLEEGAA